MHTKTNKMIINDMLKRKGNLIKKEKAKMVVENEVDVMDRAKDIIRKKNEGIKRGKKW